MNKFNRTSFAFIANDNIPKIEQAVSERRLSIKPGSRFDTYFKCIRMLATSTSEAQSKFGLEIIITSFKEIDELYGIVLNYSDDYSSIFINKFDTILRGSTIPNLNEGDAKARNTAFELNVGAHLRKAGFQTTLCEPDIKVNINNIDVSIACKRPASINNFGKILRDARRQIVKRGNGIVAVSLDKLINPSFDILEGKNTSLISKRVIVEIDLFKDKKREIIEASLDDRKILGILFSMSLVAKDIAEGIFVTYQQLVFSNLCSNNSPYLYIFKELESKLSPISF